MTLVNVNLNPKFCTVCLWSRLLTKEKVSFISVLLKTDRSFGVNSALRTIWIKSLNSVAQHSGDTLRHPLCAVTHFLQHNWSSHRWCHLNTGLPFRSCFVEPVHDRADQLHHSNSNKWTGYGEFRVHSASAEEIGRCLIFTEAFPPPCICLSVPWKRHVWLCLIDYETWNPLGTTDESSRTDSRTEVTTSNPSTYEISDLPDCLLTQTKWLLFNYAKGLCLFLFSSLCNVSRLLPLTLPQLWWPRLERRNEKASGVRKEMERGV